MVSAVKLTTSKEQVKGWSSIRPPLRISLLQLYISLYQYVYGHSWEVMYSCNREILKGGPILHQPLTCSFLNPSGQGS